MILIFLFLAITILFSGCAATEEVVANVDDGAQIDATNTAETAPVAVEDEAILDFPIELISGGTTSLRDYQGKTVLVVFFSVNCGHCHNESSHLEAIYQDYKGQGFIILSAEVSGANSDTLQEFAKEYGITFPLGTDTGAQFARYMEVTGVPHNLLIDTNGNVATIIRGFRDEESLRSSIELQLGN